MEEIAIIIPVKQSRVKPDCFVRLTILGRLLRAQGFKNIVVSDCSNRLGRALIKTVSKHINATYVHSFEDVYTPGRVKNLGGFEALQANGVSSLLFLDVDVMLSPGGIQRLKQFVKDKVPFEWFPVAFLNSPRGTLAMARAAMNSDLLSTYSKNLHQVGYVTGIQYFDVDFFQEMEGYNLDYTGYGCEDIEMLHTATARCGLRPAFPRGHSYFEDHRTVTLSEYRGFRKFYFEQKRDFPLNEMPMHFHHQRKVSSRYLRARLANDKRLLEVMEATDSAILKDPRNNAAVSSTERRT